jgi:hypothetical protein
MLRNFCLSIDDFPPNLTMNKLSEYILDNYPNAYVTITQSPLYIFGILPSELIGKILIHASLIIPAMSVSKALNQILKKELYEMYSSKPISLKEIKNMLFKNYDNSSSDFIAINIDSYNSSYFAVYNSKYDKYCDIDLHIISSGNILATLNYIGEFEWSSDTQVDIFSRYRIRKNRMNLINHYPHYAKNYLIKEYYDEIVPDLNDVFKINDVIRIIILSTMAYIIDCINDNEVLPRYNSFTFVAKNNLIMLNEFKIYQEYIRKHIIKLTDIEISKIPQVS